MKITKPYKPVLKRLLRHRSQELGIARTTHRRIIPTNGLAVKSLGWTMNFQEFSTFTYCAI
ncbi:unnamed protein product [Acanthoscelides obtectus]|uniref:Uncharacterized protein n=1 Tax=Acanthoscelides obtectus TaxID=200917 RepID=A0A9P0Q4P1_ACAOB|nr:unnamed protein product [Acanthoscelides obtectus]CAK1674345.1 hypothetical protein AOBTE_LOCUS29598 [Acanthoscelides obtectus]